jgi:hypothetical protein
MPRSHHIMSRKDTSFPKMMSIITKANYEEALAVAIRVFKKHADENNALANQFRHGGLGILLSPATIDLLEKQHRDFASSFEQGATLLREALSKERAK